SMPSAVYIVTGDASLQAALLAVVREAPQLDVAGSAASASALMADELAADADVFLIDVETPGARGRSLAPFVAGLPRRRAVLLTPNGEEGAVLGDLLSTLSKLEGCAVFPRSVPAERLAHALRLV